MGALTVNAADQAKGSHRLHSQPRAGQATTRLAGCQNASTASTAPVQIDIVGSVVDSWRKLLPWVLTALGALLAIGLAARTNELHQSNSKKETEPLKHQEIHDALGTNPKDFNLGNPEAIYKFFDTKLRTAWNNLSEKEKFELIDKYPTISGRPIDEDSLKPPPDFSLPM